MTERLAEVCLVWMNVGGRGRGEGGGGGGGGGGKEANIRVDNVSASEYFQWRNTTKTDTQQRLTVLPVLPSRSPARSGCRGRPDRPESWGINSPDFGIPWTSHRQLCFPTAASIQDSLRALPYCTRRFCTCVVLGQS
jgi:hypothetical protein